MSRNHFDIIYFIRARFLSTTREIDVFYSFLIYSWIDLRKNRDSLNNEKLKKIVLLDSENSWKFILVIYFVSRSDFNDE